MVCNISDNIHNITIDSDGCLRLCLRIRGINCPDLNIDDLISSYGQIHDIAKETFKSDHTTLCFGCNWTCMLMSEFYSNHIINH